MNELETLLQRRVAELGAEFDQTFARPLPVGAEDLQSLLAIRVAGHPLALRLSELSGLEARRRIVPLPGSLAELEGLAGLRGRLVSVFQLASLLGCGPERADWRWLVLARGEEVVAFAFGEVEGLLRVPRAALHPTSGDDRAAALVDEHVQLEGISRGVLRISRVVAALRARSGGNHLDRGEH